MTITQATFQSQSAYVARKDGVADNLKAFMDEQIEFILNHRATEHPFLNAYAKTGLPKEKSKILYLETLHYFKHLPFYVCSISTITRDEDVLRAISFNARDELGESQSHSDMYRKFLIGMGISEEEIDSYVCLPSTQALNDGICALYSKPPLQKALGALFADETMSAAMVSKYNDGLIKEGYDERMRLFWTIHITVEVGHSNAIFNVMEKHLQTPEQRKLFAEGARQYLHLIEMYWDGIARKINGNNH